MNKGSRNPSYSIRCLFFKVSFYEPSSDQCLSCFHFRRGICELGLPLALRRDSDFYGWFNTW